MADGNSPPIPKHVPKELISTFDFEAHPGMDAQPFSTLLALHDGPEAFYTQGAVQTSRDPSRPGAWVFTSMELIRDAFQHPELFSSDWSLPSESDPASNFKVKPIMLDPPEHGKYRVLLAPLFAPKAIDALEAEVERVTTQLIDRIVDKGQCEFIADFARPFPITIFMNMMGLPEELTDQFIDWEMGLLHPPVGDNESMGQASANIAGYLMELIAQRRKDPKGDIVSQLIDSDIEGEPLSDMDILNMSFLLYVAGLDTVTSTLGFAFEYLANHPEDQRKLRENPELVPTAVEELVRAYPVATATRVLTQDVEFHGLQLKKGEIVLLSPSLSNSDANVFNNPETIDLLREPNSHLTFAGGPHRCVGSHLARRELRIAVREWTRRVPDFQIKPGTQIHSHPGKAVLGLVDLPLVWDVKK